MKFTPLQNNKIKLKVINIIILQKKKYAKEFAKKKEKKKEIWAMYLHIRRGGKV